MNGILLNKTDTVVTVTEDIPAGASVSYLLETALVQVSSIETIPQYHKMAIVDIKTGEKIIKYGEPIGHATKNILIGQHVHTHNMDNQ